MLKIALGIIGFAAVVVGTFAAHTGSAQAAAGGNGKNVYTIQADCGDGSIDVRVNLAAGQFSAAHAVAGGTLVPVSFGPTTGSFTDRDGNTFPINDPAVDKGQSAHASPDKVTCSYDIDVTFPDDSALKISGTVTGFYPGGAD